MRHPVYVHLGFVAVAVLLLLLPTVGGSSGLPSPAPPPGSHQTSAALRFPSEAGSGAAAVEWSIRSPPSGLYNFSLAFSANVSLPTGGIDVGSTRVVPIAFDAPPNATLNLSVGSMQSSVAVPTLGTIGPITVPGLVYNITVGSVTLEATVEVTLQTSVAGLCTSVPSVSGCNGMLRWNRSGDQELTFTAAPDALVGGRLGTMVTGISFAFNLSVDAVVQVPIVGQERIPIGSPLSFSALPGTPENLSSNLTITARPEIHDFNSSLPSPSPLGSPLILSVNADGGSGPLHYEYTGLPSPCATTNSSSLNCTPEASATYAVNASVTDPQGFSAVAGLHLTIAPPGGSGTHGGGSNASASASGPWSNPLVVAVLAGAAGAALMGAVIWAFRRRRTGGP